MDDGPSETARRVAAHRLAFSRVPAAYGDPAADEALAADVAAGHVAPSSRMHDYLAARTAFFDRAVVGALDRGMPQVVIGAAGYDGRAFRYARPGVRWFEVDHPATQRDKLARLARLGIAAPQVAYVSADFRADPVAERLLAAGFDPAAPALFLLEGVAVYLEPGVLERLLGQLRQVAATGSSLVISVSLSSDHDQGARARFQAAVAAVGEPARSVFDADDAERLLARTGWQVIADAGSGSGGEEAAARSGRRRAAGLLMATASSRPARTSGPLPLPSLLSQALVAFTIEFDNEAEHRIPHRTTSFGSAGGGDTVWLVSLAMWENCMRYVGEEPVTVRELQRLARTGTNLDGMRRWGYVTIDGTSEKVHKRSPGPDAVLRATAKGLMARQIWQPLAALIEQRWRERFGAAEIGLLRDRLQAVAGRLDPGLPDCLPILDQGLFSRGPGSELPPRPGRAEDRELSLPALLSRVLLAFAVEYESESGMSLAAAANLLRVLGAQGTRLRDLPPLAGISKEAVRWALGTLERAGLAVAEPDPAASRGKIARLTPAGVQAQRAHHELTAAIERRWQARFGAGAIGALRRPLEALATGSGDEPPPLFQALRPYPDNWRAGTRPPASLPHYPMVLHRGGYPDGS
jgi:methyltransferase (TIGR00027 family)